MFKKRKPLSLIVVGIIFLGIGILFSIQNSKTSVTNINAFASVIVNDFLPNADYGTSVNSIQNTGTGFFYVLDDDVDSTYVKSNSTSATSGNFGITYACPGTCPSGAVTNVKVKIRNVRSANAGTGASFNIELKRTDGLVLGNITGIPFSGTAPTIGAYETSFAVDPGLNVNAGQLATVITWSKASSSGSEVRFNRARLDVTTLDSGQSDTIPPTVSISSPANGTIFIQAGNIVVEAVANDNVAVARVEFWRDGAMQSIDYSNINPHTYTWPVTGGDNGSHSFTVKAFDTASPQLSAETTITTSINIPVTPTPTPSPTPTTTPTGSINFIKRTNLDTQLSFPDSPQTYSDTCASTGTDCSQYDPFSSPPATYSKAGTGCAVSCNSDLVYESELQILTDPINAPGRGKVVKHYPLPSYPSYAPGHTSFEHHGFIFTSVSCPSGNCWYAGLYYFPQAIPASATHNLNIMGAQGTSSGGYLATLTKQGKIQLYGDSEQNGIPIIYGKWISVRVYAPAANNITRRLVVTDLDGNPVVTGETTIENTKIYASGVGGVNRVKFGCGGELDEFDPALYRSINFWWYQDNMYVADQVADPGVWKE